MNSRFSLTKHAAGSGGTLRAQVQQITWRESLARWIMAGLHSRWTLKHAGKGMLSLLLLLVGWGVVMPVQANLIAWYKCEKDANDYKPLTSPYAKHNGYPSLAFSEDDPLIMPGAGDFGRNVCQFNKPEKQKNGKTVSAITNRYIEVPHHADFDLSNGSFALSACIYQTERNGSYSGMIFANRGTANGWLFGVSGKGDTGHVGTLKFRVKDNDETNVLRAGYITLDAWHSVVLVYVRKPSESKGLASMYIDGKWAGSKPLISPASRTVTDASLFIGKNSETYEGNDVNDHPYWWFGQMSDLRIDRIADQALSQGQIDELATHCLGGPFKNEPPKINFTVSPLPQNKCEIEPLNVTLSAAVEDPEGDSFVTEYSVVKIPGGEQPLSGSTTTLTEGNYLLKVTATDSEGNKSYDERYICIVPEPLPEINSLSVSPEFNIITGSTVTLNATVKQPDGDSFAYFVDDEPRPGNTTTFTKPGSHVVKVIATDSKGNQSLPFYKTITVTAANVEPVSCFSPFNDVTGNATELTVEFDAACSRDTEPGTIKKYQWFMNGTKYSEQQKFSFAPTEAGKYVFKLQVTDNEDLPSLDTKDEEKTVTVNVAAFNQPPVADFVVKKLPSGDVMLLPTGVATFEVTVDADDTVYTTTPDGKQYYSKDPDGTIVQYEWKTSTGQTASGKTANLRFESVGQHTITLTVTDDKSKTATKEISVVVNKKLYRFMVKDYPSSVKPGQEFEVTLQFVPDEEKPADGVSVYLDFDPTVLKAKKIEGSGVLDYESPKNGIYDDHIQFAARSFDNPVPTQPYNLVTITFEALATAGDVTTLLKFNSTKTFSTSQGKYLPSSYGNDIPITIGDKTQLCQVQWQEGNTSRNRKTRLDIYCATTGKMCATANVDSAGICTISGTIPASETFICVKDSSKDSNYSYSLANKIKGPFSDSSSQVNFGTLLTGDVNGDGWTDPQDESALSECNQNPPKNCQMEWHTDLNADGNFNKDDLTLLGNNLVNSDRRPSQQEFDTEQLCINGESSEFKEENLTKLPTAQYRIDNPKYRKGQRSNGPITFQTTPIPMGLPVASTFEVQVLVNADATHSVNTAAVYLNFDPQRLKVNRLTAGNSLDYVLKQTFDNAKGQVNFASVLWDNKLPTDTFSLVTINFTLLGENGERTLIFNTTAPRQTTAAAAGEYVNTTSAIKFAEKPLTYVISDYLLDQAGHPLAGVTIHIGDQTAVTNDQGYWKITDLPEGSYTVTAQKDDYSFTTAPCALSREQMDCQMVKPKSLLKLTVDYPPEVTLQQEFDYTITITNGSPQTVTGVTLTDTLPNGVAALSLDSTTGNGLCDLSTLTCNGLTLDAGASATVKLHVINLQSETLKNTLTVTANEQPAAVQTVTSTVKADLSVTVKDTPDPVGMQKDLQYEVTVALADQATSPATGVTLELTLPTGVTLKTFTLEHGQCDTTTQLPKVTCHLDDLAVEGLKQVPLTLTTSLQDAGLLLLTLQAKLSSNEYPTTTVRERTKVFVPPEIKVDLALVIDTTNSMQGEINGVKAALKKFMATNDPNTAPLMALITFKDEVTVKAFTRDMNVLLKAIDALKAEGGGTCPEASVEALAFTVVHVKKGGQIWFTTDASPYPDADMDGLTKLLQDNETVLNATITGDCSMVDSVNDAQWEDVVNGK